MIERSVIIHPRAYEMPSPALRLWAYLITVPRYRGTPSGLHEEVRQAGCVISRRALPVALDWLSRGGMAHVYRRGTYLEVDILEAVA